MQNFIIDLEPQSTHESVLLNNCPTVSITVQAENKNKANLIGFEMAESLSNGFIKYINEEAYFVTEK